MNNSKGTKKGRFYCWLVFILPAEKSVVAWRTETQEVGIVWSWCVGIYVYVGRELVGFCCGLGRVVRLAAHDIYTKQRELEGGGKVE